MRWLRIASKDLVGKLRYGSALDGYASRAVENRRFCNEMNLLGQTISQNEAAGHYSTRATPVLDSSVSVFDRHCGGERRYNMLFSTQSHFRHFSSSASKVQPISRDWLAKLWVQHKQKGNARSKSGIGRKLQIEQPDQHWCRFINVLSSLRVPAQKVLPIIPDYDEVPSSGPQPPISQYGGDALEPRSSEEVRLAPLLSRSNLVITRDVEWANIMFAFEQESRYAIVDPCFPHAPVGLIREQSNIITRQLLRSRRPFIAYITDAFGNEIFRVRRPFFFINSTIYVEVDGKEVGVVHSRWHLWRRIYELYLGNKQFALVENPGFWNWTFNLIDEDDNLLAQIDRNWRGLGLELFTDAGQYVIRFGDADSISHVVPASTMEALQVARPLTLSERAIVVALAISLDCDYFSRSGGWGWPIFLVGE